MDLTTLVGFELSFLLLALLFVQLVRMNLLKFSMLYSILVASKAIVGTMLYPDLSIVPIIVTGVLSFVLIVLIVGLLGNRVSTDNYTVILATAGLFPWYLDGGLSFLFFIFVSIITIAYTEFKIRRAFKAIGEPKLKFNTAEKRLSPEKYAELKKHGSAFFAMPVALAALISAFIVTL